MLSLPGYAQDLKVTGNYLNSSPHQVLKDLEAQYPVRFFYHEDWIPDDSVNLQFVQKPLSEVLEQLLKNSTLYYFEYHGDKFIIGDKNIISDLGSTEYFTSKQTSDGELIDLRFPILTVGDSTSGELIRENILTIELNDRDDGHDLAGVSLYLEKLDLSMTSDNSGAD